MAEFEALDQAVVLLSKSIADFPVGAISLNDLKPTDEKIRDIRESVKGLNAKILILKAKADAFVDKTSGVLEENENETYMELQDEIAHMTINNKAIEICLQNTAAVEILENSEDTEISRKLQATMLKLYTMNDLMISMDQKRVITMAKERELKLQLQESLSEFGDFLKEQQEIRKKKLEETNPEIARQKESMQSKLQKINIMKRLIMNFIGASSDMIQDNALMKRMIEEHRELVDLETVVKMAQETAEDKT